jgi:hypothetical protein
MPSTRHLHFVECLRNSVNSIVELAATKKGRLLKKRKKKKNVSPFVTTSNLSIDNVWPSFNGLMG